MNMYLIHLFEGSSPRLKTADVKSNHFLKPQAKV